MDRANNTICGNVVHMGSLREEQKRIGRDRILKAVASEIAERGLLDFSVPAVAERAGVSQRTVYNYFDTKEALVEALPAWFDDWTEAHGGTLVEPDLDKIGAALVVNFGLFSEAGDMTAALARIKTAEAGPAGDRQSSGVLTDPRTNDMRKGLATMRPDLSDADLEAATAIFRSLMRFDMWNRLANDHELGGTDAGRVAAWAFTELLAAFRDGRGPFVADADS